MTKNIKHSICFFSLLLVSPVLQAQVHILSPEENSVLPNSFIMSGSCKGSAGVKLSNGSREIDVKCAKDKWTSASIQKNLLVQDSAGNIIVTARQEAQSERKSYLKEAAAGRPVTPAPGVGPVVKINSVTDKNSNASSLKVEGTCVSGLQVLVYLNGQQVGATSCANQLFSLDNITNLDFKSILKATQTDSAGRLGVSEIPIDGRLLQTTANIHADGFVSTIDSAATKATMKMVNLNFRPGSSKANIQDEIYAKLTNAVPGTRLVWPAGRYTDLGELKIFYKSGKSYVCPVGQSQKPIVIEASEPGQVILEGYTRISLCGSYVVFRGFKFSGIATTAAGVINMGHASYGACLYCAVRQVHFDGLNQAKAISDTALTYISVGNKTNSRNNELTDSRFENKSGIGVMVKVDPDSDGTNTDATVRIRGNYFQRTYPGEGNGFEVFRFGDSSSSHLSGKVILEHNLIENTTSEIETVSLKSHKNIIRFNTFYQVSGAVTNRIGYDNIFEGNYFLGNNVAGVGAFRLMGQNHMVVGNHIEGVGWGSKTNTVESIVFHNTDSNMKGSTKTTEQQDRTGSCDYTNYCQVVNPILFGNYLINNASYVVANADTSNSGSSFNEDNDRLDQPVGVKMFYNIFNAANDKLIFTAANSKVYATYNWAGFDQSQNNWFAGKIGATAIQNGAGFQSQQKLNVFKGPGQRFSLPDSAGRAQLTLDESKASELGLSMDQRRKLVSYKKNLYQISFPLSSTDVGQFSRPYP